MGKFDGYLICTDCDGTLTDVDGNLSEENAKAIRYFQNEGGLFTLATGRFPEHIRKFQEQLEVNAPVVSLNGVLLYDLNKEETILDLSLTREECIPVIEYIHEKWPQVWEYWFNYSRTESYGYICSKEKENPKSYFSDMVNGIPDMIGKIVFMQSEQDTTSMQEDLKEKFGDKFRFDSSWPNGLEMQTIKSSKGIAIESLKKRLGNIKKVVCAGDYDNDISMLKTADISYAVENALEAVKEAADRVTVSNNENALAHIIADLENEI